MTPPLTLHHPDACPACDGRGYSVEHEEPCLCCDGEGSVILRLPAHCEPVRLYLAMTADGPIDEGTRLESFLTGLLEAWPDLEEDVAVFLAEEGQSARVVCVLKPGPHGVNIVYV